MEDRTFSGATGQESWGGNLGVRSILCPVEISDVSRRALRYAAQLASHFQARLYVQHTFPELSESATSTADRLLRIEDLPPALQAQEIDLRNMLEEVLGDPARAMLLLNDGDARERILETISSKGIDLMVIGTRGRRGLRRLVQGSLTERVVHEATCPSLVISRKGAVHAAGHKFDPLRLKTILVPTNFSRNASRLLIYALRWAVDPAATVVLFHSVETAPPALEKLSDLLPEYNPDLEKRLREASDKMRALAPFPERLPCKIEHEVRDGDPTEQILQVAKERRADLIIMGARLLAAPGLAWGSTIAGVVRDGRFPVLAVRHLGE